MNTHARLSGISGKSMLAFAGIVLLLGVVTGQAAAATVSGTVTNNGVGVADRFVVATTPAPNFEFLAEAQTNESGSYTISLPTYMVEGTQFLVFVDLTRTRLLAALNDTIEKTLTFTGADLGPVDFKLVDGVKLSGTVTVQSNGRGADGVIVFATNPSLGWKFLGQVTTGGDGTYGLLVPPEETAELAVDTQGKFPGTVVDPAFLDVVIPKQPTRDQEGKNFSLIPGVTVQGTVQYIDGSGSLQPISNALVEAFYVATTGWVWLDDDVTGLDGFYSVAVAASWGEILLRVTASGFVEKRVDVTWYKLNPPQTKDVNVVLSTSVQISGRVTDASTGKGIGGVPVVADFFDRFYSEPTDTDGFYTLDVYPNLGQGTIHVDVGTYNITHGTNYLQPPDQQVFVGIEDITRIDFALTPAVWITGTVTDASSHLQIVGAGVSAIQGAIVLASALTDTTGVYTLKVAANLGWVDIRVEASSYQTTVLQVEVKADNITHQDFALMKAIDTVSITKATWCKNQLTVFATSSLQPNATLYATVTLGTTTVLKDVTMTYSSKRKQYDLRVRINTPLVGGTVTVTSSKGGSKSETIGGC